MLNRLKFSIDIKEDKSKIWKAIWKDKCYRDWVGIFSEGAYYQLVDQWQEGDKIMFLDPEQNGIYSKISKYVPDSLVHFNHIASVANGNMQQLDDESKKWTGANEIYSLKDSGEFVSFLVEIDVLDQHVEIMSTLFPQALEIVKENSLRNRCLD